MNPRWPLTMTSHQFSQATTSTAAPGSTTATTGSSVPGPARMFTHVVAVTPAGTGSASSATAAGAPSGVASASAAAGPVVTGCVVTIRTSPAGGGGTASVWGT